jgi:hypothetical protein
MKTAKAWKVTVKTEHGGQWKGRFLFKPSATILMVALEGDLEDGERALERCDRAEADEIEYYQERLRQLQDVVRNTPDDFADTQVHNRIKVAGTTIGAIQVTTEKVYTPGVKE